VTEHTHYSLPVTKCRLSKPLSTNDVKWRLFDGSATGNECPRSSSPRSAADTLDAPLSDRVRARMRPRHARRVRPESGCIAESSLSLGPSSITMTSASSSSRAAAYDSDNWSDSSRLTSKQVRNKGMAVRKVATPLRELTCHIGSHSVTCHLAEVTFPLLPQPKLVFD